MSFMIALHQPIETTVDGERKAFIVAINPTSTDCLHGYVLRDDGSHHYVNWDLSGFARDNPSELNLDFRREELDGLKEYAKRQLNADVLRFL